MKRSRIEFTSYETQVAHLIWKIIDELEALPFLTKERIQAAFANHDVGFEWGPSIKNDALTGYLFDTAPEQSNLGTISIKNQDLTQIETR